MIEFDDAQFDYVDVQISSFADIIGFVYDDESGELVLFGGGVFLTNTINNEILATISVTGEPGMCVTDFIHEAVALQSGIPEFIDISECVNISPNPSCFRDAETICGNIQNGNGNCNETNNEAILGANVIADDGCGNPVSGTTDSNGDYCIDIFEGECVDLSVDNSDCPVCENAITELDGIFLSDLRDLMLGITTGTSTPLTNTQLLAADLNGDGKLTNLDLVIMSVLIGGYSLPIEIESCRFHPVSFDVKNDIFGVFPQAGNSCDGMDFIMIVPGDLNGNCGECNFSDVDRMPENEDPSVYTVETNNNFKAISFNNDYNSYFMSFEISSNFDLQSFFNLDESTEYEYILHDGILSIYISSKNGNWKNGFVYYNTNELKLLTENIYTIDDTGVSKVKILTESRSLNKDIDPITLIKSSDNIEVIFNQDMKNVSISLVNVDGSILYQKNIDSIMSGSIEKLTYVGNAKYMYLSISSLNHQIVEPILNIH